MVNVNSEIGALKKVIVHTPDKGISRVSPKRAEELLFDDIVYLPQMRIEHDKFLNVLRAFLGADNVLEVEDLLEDTMKSNPRAREILLDAVIDFEELPKVFGDELKAMDNHRLTEVLITGYHPKNETVYFDPIPNFIFTRDIAVTVKDHVIVTKAAKTARYRENLLTRFIFKYHDMFKELEDSGKLINLNDLDAFPPNRRGEEVSIEGGDIMMLSNDFLLIGCSERTSEHAFYSLKNFLFEKGLVKNVVQVNIPADRSFMHIDTLFTRISETDVVAYKPIIYDGQSSNVHVYRDTGGKVTYSSVKEFFIKEINAATRFIFTGNGISPFQEREQWTDGCNLVALRPGVAITYDRNPKTEKAFIDAGYKILHAEDFLDRVIGGELDPHKIKNTIITLASGELSRARGGSHCMTCPIVRENLAN